jgi:hypothetical protein
MLVHGVVGGAGGTGCELFWSTQLLHPRDKLDNNPLFRRMLSIVVSLKGFWALGGVEHNERFHTNALSRRVRCSESPL